MKIFIKIIFVFLILSVERYAIGENYYNKQEVKQTNINSKIKSNKNNQLKQRNIKIKTHNKQYNNTEINAKDVYNNEIGDNNDEIGKVIEALNEDKNDHQLNNADGINTDNTNNNIDQNTLINKQILKEPNGFIKFIRNYIMPDNHPVFKDSKNSIYIFGGYDVNDLMFGPVRNDRLNTNPDFNLLNPSSDFFTTRKGLMFAINYGRFTRIAMLNGRFSLGFFAFNMIENFKGEEIVRQAVRLNNDLNEVRVEDNVNNVIIPTYKLNTFVIGGEAIQELFLGHQNLYFSFGIGFSYIFFIDSRIKDDTLSLKYTSYSSRLNFNSQFNFVGKASLGHRFDFGLVIEATFKYYTNGGLNEYNRPFSLAGLTIGYVF